MPKGEQVACARHIDVDDTGLSRGCDAKREVVTLADKRLAIGEDLKGAVEHHVAAAVEVKTAGVGDARFAEEETCARAVGVRDADEDVAIGKVAEIGG
jgi:hypothetical protein